MRLLSSDDSGSEHSDRTMILTEVVALIGKKGYRARVAAFEMLYAYYQQPIKRYLAARVQDQESAADLCQITFLRVWKLFLHLETKLPMTVDHLRNWLYKIASDVAIDDHRRKKPIAYIAMLENEVYSQLPEPTVQGEAEWIDDRVTIQEAIPHLPPMQRDSLVMHLSGYREKEIAAKLRISPSAVSMNVSRGRTELHRKYFPVTIDLQRANISNAEQVMLSILEGAIGVINSDKVKKYTERALDWDYRQYMKKHVNEVRAELLVNDPARQAWYADTAKRIGKNCWRELLVTEDKESPFYECGTFMRIGRLYSYP